MRGRPQFRGKFGGAKRKIAWPQAALPRSLLLQAFAASLKMDEETFFAARGGPPAHHAFGGVWPEQSDVAEPPPIEVAPKTGARRINRQACRADLGDFIPQPQIGLGGEEGSRKPLDRR
ncbi:hypothetical protein FHS91_000929 [Sphingobium xanthum]